MELIKRIASCAKRPVCASVSWVDDHPTQVTGISNVMQIRAEEEIGISLKIDIVKSPDEVIERAASLSGVILDIQLDEKEKIDGVIAAEQIRGSSPWLPVSFVSAYLEQNERRVKEIRNVGPVLDRTEIGTYKSADYIKSLLNTVTCYALSKHIGLTSWTWDELKSKENVDDYIKLHAAIFQNPIREELYRRGWAWLVICGEKIVIGSKEFNEFPSYDQRYELSKRHGSVAFTYSRPILSEESEHDLKLSYYPSLKLEVDGNQLSSDFDTGTNQTIVSDKFVQKEPLATIENSTHFGVKYYYSMTQRAFSIVESCSEGVGRIDSVKVPIAIIEDWHNSPWIKINPAREALLGRDVFDDSRVKLSLAHCQVDNRVCTKISEKEEINEP